MIPPNKMSTIVTRKQYWYPAVPKQIKRRPCAIKYSTVTLLNHRANLLCVSWEICSPSSLTINKHFIPSLSLFLSCNLNAPIVSSLWSSSEPLGNSTLQIKIKYWGKSLSSKYTMSLARWSFPMLRILLNS